MRRWFSRARASADVVADAPTLWLPGALAWLLTVGWIPLLAATWRPSVSGLTYFGSGFFSSGAWPWNALAVSAGVVVVVAVAFVLAAAAEAALIGLIGRRRVSPTAVLRTLGVAIVTAAPAVLLVLTAVLAAVIIAPSEFNAASDTDPLVRTLLRLAPILAAAAVAATAGAALHAGAVRHVLGAGGSVLDGLGGGARRLRRAGWAALVQAVAVVVARVAYLLLAILLLVVLWAPIGERLRGGIEPATALLLVGFVAVWMCLVLGGGALQAWGSVTWTRILDDRVAAPPMRDGREASIRS